MKKILIQREEVGFALFFTKVRSNLYLPRGWKDFEKAWVIKSQRTLASAGKITVIKDFHNFGIVQLFTSASSFSCLSIFLFS